MLRKKKKFFKILSVLVAVIIAFSSFIIPISAVTISGDKYLDFLEFKDLSMIAVVYNSSNKPVSQTRLTLKPVGVSGDGSLKIDCSVSNASAIIPNGCKVSLTLNWLSTSDGSFYISFPDSFIGLKRLTGQASSKVSDFLFSVNSPLASSSNNTVTFQFTPNVSFSRFYLSFSLEDPTVVPPMEAFLNDLGDFCSYSLGNLSNFFNFSYSNAPLLLLIFGFVSVGFVFGILYRLVKR